MQRDVIFIFDLVFSLELTFKTILHSKKTKQTKILLKPKKKTYWPRWLAISQNYQDRTYAMCNRHRHE